MEFTPKLFAIVFKILFITFFIKLIISNINPNASLFNQHWVVWVLLYVPIFMGYEALFSIIFNKNKSK